FSPAAHFPPTWFPALLLCPHELSPPFGRRAICVLGLGRPPDVPAAQRNSSERGPSGVTATDGRRFPGRAHHHHHYTARRRPPPPPPPPRLPRSAPDHVTPPAQGTVVRRRAPRSLLRLRWLPGLGCVLSL